MGKFLINLFGWLLPRAAVLALLFIVGFRMVGGSPKVCLAVGIAGFLSFIVGYFLSEFDREQPEWVSF